MITFVGGNDQLIMPRGVINYYREMAARYGTSIGPDAFKEVQKFYRLFHAPGVGHCGLGILGNGSQGPWPEGGADFDALINWVENGIAPSQVLGQGYTAGTNPNLSVPPTYNLTRPLCPYPQTAVYTGTGSVYSAANWQCGGNLETPQTICPNALVEYKDEVDGPIDYSQSGISPFQCGSLREGGFGGEGGVGGSGPH
jgi:hypothetical protein